MHTIIEVTDLILFGIELGSAVPKADALSTRPYALWKFNIIFV